ncbi:MAG: ATP-dependent dethiobiotin synthetase BioD, partial [Moorea sp. SIO4A3]|nr:ATP-dependent dethiobiotin synthetase BioD [Moorena sp. SIO4A3]
RSSRVDLKGIVLNCVQPRTSEEINQLAPIRLIESLTNVKVLGTLPHLSDPMDYSKLVQVGSNLDVSGW